MSTIIHDCPRCNAKKITFDVFARNPIMRKYGAHWQENFEICGRCRNCGQFSILVIKLHKYESIDKLNKRDYWDNFHYNEDFSVVTYISIRHNSGLEPPEHLPDNVKLAFSEASSCLAFEAFNAAAAMFRLAIDLSTKELLPPEGEDGGPTRHQRRELASRLSWLFEHQKLPKGLEKLAECVRQDGNDGVHDGTIDRAEAEDLADFTVALLVRIYTEPARLVEAEKRRIQRRAKN